MYSYRYMRDQDGSKASHGIFLTYGKFLSNTRKFKDCQIEIRYQDQSMQRPTTFGIFEVSNIISFNSGFKSFSARNGDKIKIFINLKRNGDTVDNSYVNVEIDSKNVYYSRIVELAGNKFQIVFYVVGSFDCKNLTLSIDYPKFQRFELPDFNIGSINDLPPFGIRFDDNDRTLIYKGGNIESFQEYGATGMRQLSVFTLMDHPNILKMVGYNCDQINKIGFYVEHAENGYACCYEANQGVRNILAGIFSAMAYLNSCGFFNVDLHSGAVLQDFNSKIFDFRSCRSIDEEVSSDIRIARRQSHDFAENFYDYQYDVYSAGEAAYSLIDEFISHITLYSINIIKESLEEGEYINNIPYQTQVILRAMLSRELIQRPTFFELGLLLNLGHFHVIGDNGNRISDVYNEDYETGNDFLFYSRSTINADRFHCIMFHWFHGNFALANEICEEGKNDGDKFMSYMSNYINLYESQRIDSKSRLYLYDQFMGLDFNDYRFWLMPPPNLMPQNQNHKLEYEEATFSRSELALMRFNRFYDERNRDHEYDKFFPLETQRILENLETKFFNLCQIFPEMKKYSSLYYLVVHHDIEQSNYHYENCDESVQDEIFEMASRCSLDVAQELFSNVEEFIELSTKFNLLSRLVRCGKLTDPIIQFQVGIECIKQLDYENGKHFICESANQKYELAIFFKSLLTFHGHCYAKEREESLQRMVSAAKILKGRYAFEVAMILLQDMNYQQRNDEGLEMLRIAESDFIIPDLVREGIYHVKTSSLYYDLLEAELDFYSQSNKSEMIEANIKNNPIHLFNIGKSAFLEGEQEKAREFLRCAIEQDYLEAEFIYSLFAGADLMFDHLFRGSMSGCIESQIFLGLHFIYGAEHEDKRQEGIRWLNVALRQNKPLTLKILSELNTNGSDGISYDEKANECECILQSLPDTNNAETNHLCNEKIERIIMKCCTNLTNIFS